MNNQIILSEIVKKDNNSKMDNKSFNDIFIANIDKYVVEIIRISEMYKFELKLKNKNTINQKKQQKTRQIAKEAIEIKNIDDFIIKEEDIKTEELKQYNIILQESSNEEKAITYDVGKISIKNGSKAEKQEYAKINIGYQELKDKTGFYQERSYLTTVKVQLWPEHLPYDHFKRKRAFLFL